MNELVIFENPEFGKIRTTEIDGEPWFVGKDVCVAFGDTHHKRSLGRIDSTDKALLKIQTTRGIKETTCINESGLYALLFSMSPQKTSKKELGTNSGSQSKTEERIEKLRRFKHWVTHDVLPQIRKTGTYGIHLPDGSINLDLIQALIDNERKLQEEKKELVLVNTAQSLQIAEMQPKVTYYDLVLDSKDLICTTAIAKDYGYSAQNFNKLLHELGVQYKCDGQWVLYQKYAADGYAQTKTRILDNGHVIVWTYWTQKGRLFLYDLLKSKGILPIIEREEEAEEAI